MKEKKNKQTNVFFFIEKPKTETKLPKERNRELEREI